MMHETNTFNPVDTGIDAFKRRIYLEKQEIPETRRGTNTELGGFLDILENSPGYRAVPSIFGYAWPSGVVTSEALVHFTEYLINDIKREKVDGVLLALHGAMAAYSPADPEAYEDGEGYILSRIRGEFGSPLPIVATLDLHAVLTEQMTAHGDGLFMYKTYPHMDMAERGREAASFLLKLLESGKKPNVVLSKIPLLIGPPHNVLPGDAPMSGIMKAGERLEKESSDRVVSVGIAHGFMQQDVPFAGAGVVLTGFGSKEDLQEEADKISGAFFEKRNDFFLPLLNVEQAAAAAACSEKKPVALADAGDNIGAGTPGDGTALLLEFGKLKGIRVLAQIRDPEAVKAACEKGVGGTLRMDIGGKSDPAVYGPPFPFHGTVRSLSDGRFYNPPWGGYEGGAISDMGPSARLQALNITLIVTSIQMSPNNIMHALSMGVTPEEYDVVICKGGLAFREAYKPPFALRHICCDSPGYSAADPAYFTFTRINRPIYPLDTI